jgi:hypothetical protein
MAIWCKIEGGVIVQKVNVRKDPKDIATGGDGNPVWRPYVPSAAPAYDGETHHPPVSSDDIQPTQVVQTWAAPVAKTAGEIDTDKDQIASTIDVDPYLRAFALVMLDEINTLRSQHSLADRTATQLKAAVKSKL